MRWVRGRALLGGRRSADLHRRLLQGRCHVGLRRCGRRHVPASLAPGVLTRRPGLRGPGGRALFSRCPGPFLPAGGARRAPGAHARLPDVRCPATPAFVVPARAGLGFVFAAAAPRALGVVAVLAAFPREVPDLLVSAAAGLGAGFGAAAPRFAPATLPLMVATPRAGAARPFRGAAVLEAVPPAAPAVLARVAAAGFAAAFGAPVRPLAAVPWPPVSWPPP